MKWKNRENDFATGATLVTQVFSSAGKVSADKVQQPFIPKEKNGTCVLHTIHAWDYVMACCRTPRAGSRDKVISFCVVCLSSLLLSLSLAQKLSVWAVWAPDRLVSEWICWNCWKTGLSVLQNFWHGPQASQIVHLCSCLSTKPTYWAMCSISAHVLN